MRRVPILRQTWSDIVWCHWPVSPSSVAALLPEGLVPDCFEDTAWVGLIPFTMENLRLPGPLRWLSALAGVHRFGEVNVRTYVKGPDGRTGVWFCTLDSNQWLAVKTANAAFGLPYRMATVRRTVAGATVAWSVLRRGDGASAELVVEVDGQSARPAAPGLERFLVERYALYTTWCGRLFRGELRHEPWRVRPARLQRVDIGTVVAAGFVPDGQPHVLAGEPVDVTVFRLRRVTPRR